jgi:hypothetical protein
MDVTIGCVCSGAPHETDTVTLRERLSFHDVKALKVDVGFTAAADDTTDGDTLAVLSEGYLLRGIESWSLVDDKGKPLPITRANIRDGLLSHLDEAQVVSEAAENLYNPDVLLPLVRAAQGYSPPSQTDELTSATTDSPKRSRKRSLPSLTTTTPTDDIETITPLPAGDSNSSRNSASAA